MCGILGFWTSSDPRDMQSTLLAMSQTLNHRGPDSSGCWIDEAAGIALGHQRLAIIDLSSAGHQPMHSADGRYIISFNGEIYNHIDVRSELERLGFTNWRGHSDTETLVTAIMHWGIAATLQRLNGMFAFAIWDRRRQELILARDRIGEKPLYYGTQNGVFLFGSELKALRVHPAWRGELDRSSVSSFLRHNYVPSPWSIYQGISKLKAAHYITISDRGRVCEEPICYWNASAFADPLRSVWDGDDAGAIKHLEEMLLSAVKSRMQSDVPLGAFLSGGVDSSLVLSLMQAQSERAVRSFSIGFHEREYDEAIHAKAVARHLGTEHNELYVSPRDALAVVPELGRIWDEPFSDSSQIPTLLVNKLARQSVVVGLSGDGGDELFGGYNRYGLGYNIWRHLNRIPVPARPIVSAMLSLALKRSDMLATFGVGIGQPGLVDKLAKLRLVVGQTSLGEFYQSVVSHDTNPQRTVPGASERSSFLARSEGWPHFSDPRELMMFLDLLTYLPDDILTKLDRASMKYSLEARVPLIDHRIVEFALGLPLHLKIRNGTTKWILRQVLYKYVPRALIDRPKMGFGVPLAAWLRGPLRDWAESLLDERGLVEDGIFDAPYVRRLWDEFVSGGKEAPYQLWDLIMFQSWYCQQREIVFA